METISLRFEDSIKKELDELCDEMGMDISTFFTIYVKKVLRERKIPFEISAPADLFYSESNMAQIRKADAQVRAGKVVIKTMEELEAMARE